jgi:hypothetical protein
MKVIIELSKEVAIDNVDDNEKEVRILLSIAGKTCAYAIVNIDDLKLALRKMTAK